LHVSSGLFVVGNLVKNFGECWLGIAGILGAHQQCYSAKFNGMTTMLSVMFPDILC